MIQLKAAKILRLLFLFPFIGGEKGDHVSSSCPSVEEKMVGMCMIAGFIFNIYLKCFNTISHLLHPLGLLHLRGNTKLNYVKLF